MAHPTRQCESWSVTIPPWRESWDDLWQDESTGGVCAAEQRGRNHKVAALYLVCGRHSQSQASLTLVVPASNSTWLIRRGSVPKAIYEEQTLFSGTGASELPLTGEEGEKKWGGKKTPKKEKEIWVAGLLCAKTSWIPLSKNLAKYSC